MQKIEEMRVVIEDLEALKDLNDELEENHVETEKALQEDIGEGLTLECHRVLTTVQRGRNHSFEKPHARLEI
jgi:hypothetical protein